MKSRSASLFLVLFLSVLVAVTSAATTRNGRLVGGWEWEQIPNVVKDPHVQEIGKFAVAEYNTKSKSELEFKQVVSGESQVVAGTNYRLVVEAKNGGSVAKYQALVWEKPWENSKQLTSFKPLA